MKPRVGHRCRVAAKWIVQPTRRNSTQLNGLTSSLFSCETAGIRRPEERRATSARDFALTEADDKAAQAAAAAMEATEMDLAANLLDWSESIHSTRRLRI